jgi:prepilin peptidase CpaA
MTSNLDLALACVSSVVVFLAALIDLRRSVIPNLLTLPLIGVAPLVHGFLSGPGALGAALLGACACGVVPLFAFVRGGLGGGDLKLFVALGALLGSELGLRAELCALLLAAVQAAFVLAWRGTLLTTLLAALRGAWRKPAAQGAALERAGCLRLGPSIALATWLVVWTGALAP